MAGSPGPLPPGPGRARPRLLRRARLRLEELEPRTLLSVFTPAQIRHAYGLDQVNPGQPALTGAGQTIAIIDAFDAPRIATDLQTFDRQFGIANPPLFTKVNQYGGNALPARNAQWETEISLDVEWAHAIAPGANILLVEANSASVQDMLAAVSYASKQSGVVAVSMSWGTKEFSGEVADDSVFTTPGGHVGGGNRFGNIMFVAAAGDSGSAGGPSWPAVSPNVLGVGGTSLTVTAANAYQSETGWSNGGGGTSAFEPEPAYQKMVLSASGRATPDVAFDADPGTGYYVYQSSSSTGWLKVGGTSAAAAEWAGIIALADQMRSAAGLGALGGISQSPMLFYVMKPPLHDITTGNNGHAAGPGYDEVTGLGTPIGQLLVPFLASGSGSPAPVVPSPTPTPTPILDPIQPLVPSTPKAPANNPAMRTFVSGVMIVETVEAPGGTATQTGGSVPQGKINTISPPLNAFGRPNAVTPAVGNVPAASVPAPAAISTVATTTPTTESRTEKANPGSDLRASASGAATFGGILPGEDGEGTGPSDLQAAGGTIGNNPAVASPGLAAHERTLWAGTVAPATQAVISFRVTFDLAPGRIREAPAPFQSFSPAVLAAALAVVLSDLGPNPAAEVEDANRRRAGA